MKPGPTLQCGTGLHYNPSISPQYMRGYTDICYRVVLNGHDATHGMHHEHDTHARVISSDSDAYTASYTHSLLAPHPSSLWDEDEQSAAAAARAECRRIRSRTQIRILELSI